MYNFISRILDWLAQLSPLASNRCRSPRTPVGRKRRLTLQALEARWAMTAYPVTNANASGTGSLEAEIAAAVAANDTAAVITFDPTLAGSTIQLSGSDASSAANTAGYGPTAYFINGSSGTNITIDGSNAPGLIIDGGSAVRLFAVTSGNSLTLENLTLTDGESQGTAGASGGGGGGAGLGGAVFDNGGSFIAEGCTFTNNTAQGGEGGSVDGGIGNGGGLGGGAGAFGGGGAGEGFADGNGGAGGFGGGGGGGGEGTTFTGGGNGGGGGFGGGGGGGGGVTSWWLFIPPPPGGGGAGGFGGGAGHAGEFLGPNGQGGGGAGLGGGIFSNQGTLTLTNDTFTGNSASGGSGGNAGQGLGGAVFERNGTLTATFDTFTSNTAAQGGTDVYVLSDKSNGGNNTSPYSGTGTASATLINDILGQSTATVSDFVAGTNAGAAAPTLTGSENDLISDNPASGGLTGTNITVGNPYLSSLADNGGPTETIALTADSTAAIGQAATGTGITIDQRGESRPATPDLGAYEYTLVLTPTVSVSDGGTYNGSAFTATVTVSGSGSQSTPAASLEGVTPSVTYYSGSSDTGTPLSAAPSTVGTYTALASFAGSTDYTSAAASSTFTINAATPTVTVSDAGGTYTGSAFTASATVAGVGGQSTAAASLEGVTPSLTYYSGSSDTGTPLSAAPSTAGTYTALASFAGSTDYTSAAASSTFTINAATPTVTVSDAGGTYTGSAFTATDTVAGIESQSTPAGSLEGVTPSLTYYSGPSATGTALGATPSTAGTYTALASFAGSTDYTSAAASTTFTISQSSTPPVLASGGQAATYVPKLGAVDLVPAATLSTGDGAFANASLAVVETAAATYPFDRLGIGSSGGLVVSGSSLVYNSVTVGSFTGGGAAPLAIQFNSSATQAAVLAVVQNLTFNNVNTGAMTIANRTVTLQLTDGLGHAGAVVTQTVDVVNKTNPSVRVSDAGGMFNNGAFAANAFVAGVGSQSAPASSLQGVTPSLTYYLGPTWSGTPLSGAPKTVGTYSMVASFAGSTNYSSGMASATFTISKAAPSVSVVDAGGSYSGSAFTATTTSIEGVTPSLTYYSGAAASGSPLSGPPSAVGTYTVLASFAGSADYTSGTASTTFTITPAVTPPALSIGGSSVNYAPKSAAVIIAPAATLSTGDGAFANASLAVAETAAATYPFDRLGIASAGGLVVSGSSLVYNSVTIGSFTGGGASALSIQFNGNATQAAVLAVVHNITFDNVNTGAMTVAPRSITFQLTDGLGHTGPVMTQTIVVT